MYFLLNQAESRSTFVSLKKNRDFKHVYSQGKYVANELFVAYALANHFGINRIGITVSKKVGGAVVRNRVKRRVRECVRHNNLSLQSDICTYDFVLVARKPAGELVGKGVFLHMSASLQNLFRRLGKTLAPI